MSWTCRERDGVAILCARLAGRADNNPDGVARVKDALDAVPATLAADLDVATLDVTGFSNASDDACAILTGVFAGLPCCWVTQMWDQQRDGQRWDLPASEHMAATHESAIERVVGWRRAGGFVISVAGDTRASQWTGRGLVVRDSGGAGGLVDTFYRNQLVEREIGDGRSVRVLWPVVDRTGVVHEALRRQARLVYQGERVIEADFTRWSTCLPLPDDWVARISDLDALTILDLRTTPARELDILDAVQRLPALHTLRVEPEALGADARAGLLADRPALALR